MSKKFTIIVIRIKNVYFKTQDENESNMERIAKEMNCRPALYSPAFKDLRKYLNKVVWEAFSVYASLEYIILYLL